MKITPAPYYRFRDGELLDSVRANDNLQSVLDVEADVSARRIVRSMLLLRFQTDCAAGYTQALSAENRTFRFSCPRTMVLERAFWTYEGTGTDIRVDLVEVDSGLPPAGVTNPLVSVASGAPVASDIDVTQVVLLAGVHYKFTITAAGAFSGTKADLILHLAHDRFQGLSGRDERLIPAPRYLTEQSDLSVATWLAHVDSGAQPANSNFSDGFKAGFAPVFAHMPGLTSGTSASLCRWDIPRVDTALRRQRIVAVTAYCILASAGAAGQTVTWSVQDQTGATVASWIVTVDGLTYAHFTAHSLSISLQSATAGIASTPGSDYRIVVSTNGATTIQKTYAYVWME